MNQTVRENREQADETSEIFDFMRFHPSKNRNRRFETRRERIEDSRNETSERSEGLGERERAS